MENYRTVIEALPSPQHAHTLKLKCDFAYIYVVFYTAFSVICDN